MSELNPHVADALDRLVPAVVGEGDWADVHRRAGAPAAGRRPRALRLAGIAAGLAGAAALATLLALLLIQAPSSDEPDGPLDVGDPAPAVSFPIVIPDPTHAIREPVTELAALRGQVVVIAFLDDRCAGCEDAANLLQYLTAGPASAELAVATGISAERARQIATGVVEPTRPGGVVGYRRIATAADPNGALARGFGVDTLPSLVVLNREGVVVRRETGVPERRGFADYLEGRAAEPLPADLPPAQPTQPHLSVFDDPAGPLTDVPEYLAPDRVACPYVPGSLRLAANGANGERVIVGQAIDGSILSVIDYGGALGAGVGCGAGRESDRREGLERVERRGYVDLQAGSGGGRFAIGMVLLDGYDEVEIAGRTYPVEHNGFVIALDRKPESIIIRGPAGERRASLPWAREPERPASLRAPRE